MSRITLSGNASGTGNFTLASPNSNTDRTLTLPDATGTVLTTATPGIPINGPAFRSSIGSQSLAGSTVVKLTLSGETFDTNSRFNATGSTVDGIPAYAFLPNVAGYYLTTFNLQYTGAAFTGLVSAKVYKNGSQYEEMAVVAYNLQYTRATGTTLVYMNGSTDYLEFYGFQANGTQTVSADCSASLVRAA